ncbi:MAG: hypothetical protein H0U52_10140 [Chloroflexi bacterium]|nr:hypothetical protein [Chloroflexota bacterium]
MTRREAVQAAVCLFLISVVVRTVTASFVVFPIPEDTAYYVSASRALVEGRGLVSDALWSYQTPPLIFPRPAFEVWLPLPTFLSALPMLVLGTSFRVAQLVPVIVGSLIPVLAWRIAADVAAEKGLPKGRARTLAIGTGLTCAVYLPLLLHSTLPDSTMLFAALALGACLLMTRLSAAGEAIRWVDRRLLGLGVLIGLAALTRNEAVWIGLAWAVIASTGIRAPRATRVGLIAVPGAIALLIFAPWAIRDWLVFGNPLPGQALANALSVTGFDIFAWQDPPTMSRYLAVGPARLLEMRVEGLGHNLFSVLLLPGAPLSLVGLVALPLAVRLRSLRAVMLVGGITFLVTSLAFPVATTWGTFLHAAGPVHVLLVIAALLGLDRLLAAIGLRRAWTNPVAWLAPALTVSGALLFSAVLFPSFGGNSRSVEARYSALERQMTAAGTPLATLGPIVTDFPIWLAAATGVNSLALPAESPSSVVDLASTFGARTLIVSSTDHGGWPGVLAAGGADAACFEPVDIGTPTDPSDAAAIVDTRVFRIVCP